MLLTAAETARFLGYSADHFRRNWRRWRSLHGFPAPLIALKWDQEALEGWRAARRDAAADVELPAPASAPEPDDETRRRRAQRNVDRLAKAREQSA